MKEILAGRTLLILPKACNQREEVPTNAHSPSHRLRRLASLPIHLNRDGMEQLVLNFCL